MMSHGQKSASSRWSQEKTTSARDFTFFFPAQGARWCREARWEQPATRRVGKRAPGSEAGQWLGRDKVLRDVT
jgi:hypothetical protein